MEFRLLGPLEVVGAAGPLPLGGAKPRLVLAALLVDAGALVAAGRLIDIAWGEHPPPSAANALQVHVSHLRRTLASEDPTPRLTTRAPGYVLTPLPGELDVSTFESLAATGHAQLLRGDPETAADTLRRALSLWRGPVLADLPDAAFAAPVAAGLDALRVTTRGDRIDADLALGRHNELVPELDRLVAEHTTDERLLAQQVLALYRSMRQDDALAAYHAGRRRLVDELGVEPGAALRSLEQQVLRQDPALDVAPRAIVVEAEPRRERRVVSVLAADLSGAISSSDDPETVAVELEGARARVRDAITEAGGAGTRSVGLIEVATFGAPTAYGDDAARAIACATAWHRRLPRSRPGWSSPRSATSGGRTRPEARWSTGRSDSWSRTEPSQSWTGRRAMPRACPSRSCPSLALSARTGRRPHGSWMTRPAGMPLPGRVLPWSAVTQSSPSSSRRGGERATRASRSSSP